MDKYGQTKRRFGIALRRNGTRSGRFLEMLAMIFMVAKGGILGRQRKFLRIL